MGWSYTPSISFKAFVDGLNKDWEDPTSKGVCIKHCYRGNPSGGRLWQVWGTTQTTTGGNKVSDIFIKLILLKCEKNYGWGEIHLFEETGPQHFYDCPLKYLDIVPCPKSKSAAEWRAKVYEYHNNRVAKRLARKAAKIVKEEDWKPFDKECDIVLNADLKVIWPK